MFLSGEDERVQASIPPTEDLMREHGVLKRLLLIYSHIKSRFESATLCDQNFLSSVILDTSLIAKDFIENYHQRLEEDYVFPEFIRKQCYVNLVNILREQHQAARELTSIIINYARSHNISCNLFHLMSLYINMYEPHSAREDTVIFPAFRQLIIPSRFNQLGDKFEEIEEQQFGEHGFQHIVHHVAQIEQSLGIFNLSQFTPTPSSIALCDL